MQRCVITGVNAARELRVSDWSVWCGVAGDREPVRGLAPEAAGSSDEGREHRADGVISSGLRSHQLPRVQVHQSRAFSMFYPEALFIVLANQFQLNFMIDIEFVK